MTPENTLNEIPKPAYLGDPTKSETISAIPAPADTSAANTPEYASSQIAQLLNLDTEAADSEAALACRAKRKFQDDLRYCGAFGWLQWDGKKWLTDSKNGARTAALFVTLSHDVQEEVKRLHELAKGLEKAGRTQDRSALIRAASRHQRHFKLVESERFAKAAMDLTQSAVTIDASVFQPRPWLIGFENGVWDKGEWRTHRREDYFRSLSPVHVDEASIKAAEDAGAAGSGELGAVIERITRGDHEYARTLQEVAGYTFSAASDIRLLSWAYGGPGTGKSTFSQLLKTALAEGATSLDTSLLAIDAPRDRLGAAVWGRRLVVCPEAGNKRIDVESLKVLTGSEDITTRLLYHENFDAKPTWAVLMVGNDAPTMDANDDALRDRVVALPFVHRLMGDDPENPQPLLFTDGKNIETVRSNPQSVLVREFTSWALAGMANVLATGNVFRAETTQSATQRFWKDTDKLTPFWETVPEDALRNGMSRRDLRGRYEQWCADEGIRRPIGPQPFTKACTSVGLSEKRHGNEKGWILVGAWSFAYTSYTSDPISDKPSRVREESIVEGFTENSPRSVRSVHAASDFTDWLKAVGPTDGPTCRGKLQQSGFDEVEAALDDLKAAGLIRYDPAVKGFAAA